jgi:hypothetical protein
MIRLIAAIASACAATADAIAAPVAGLRRRTGTGANPEVPLGTGSGETLPN